MPALNAARRLAEKTERAAAAIGAAPALATRAQPGDGAALDLLAPSTVVQPWVRRWAAATITHAMPLRTAVAHPPIRAGACLATPASYALTVDERLTTNRVLSGSAEA